MMWPSLLVLLMGVSPARLHVLDTSSCAPTPGLSEALSVRLPQLVIAEPGAAIAPDDRVLRLEGDALSLERPSGEQELERALMGSCDARAELAAAMLERHFTQVSWAGLAQDVTMPAAPPKPAPQEPPSPWRVRVVAGFGGGSDGALPLPRLGLEVAFGTERFDVGVLAGTSFEQRTDVFVEGRDRGEVRSRLDDVMGLGAVCARAWRFRGCAGVVAGVLVLSGEAKGELSRVDFAAVPAFALGGTASVSVDLAGRFFLSLRGTGAAPFSPPGLLVEGADSQRVVPFHAHGSLGLGVSIW